jgi:hypothetical protein
MNSFPSQAEETAFQPLNRAILMNSKASNLNQETIPTANTAEKLKLLNIYFTTAKNTLRHSVMNSDDALRKL